MTLFSYREGIAEFLAGDERRAAQEEVCRRHYAHCVPSGKTHWFRFDGVLVGFSLPANMHAGRAVFGPPDEKAARPGKAGGRAVWELTRLLAPEGHGPNLLTRALSSTVRAFSRLEPGCEALVSYADPNAGHHGGVYQAASWAYLGQSEESRAYLDGSGQMHARRKFHSGRRCLNKAEIEALGFREVRLPGKHRYARGLTAGARRLIAARAVPPPKPSRPSEENAMSSLLEVARRYSRAGLSVIPVRTDGSKRPDLDSWKRYQSERADEETLLRWFGRGGGVGIAVVCGAVSGGLEVLDFDSAQAWHDWRRLVAAQAADAQAWLDRLPRVRTPSGGRHLYLRRGRAAGNRKLARDASGKTLIEVRGEGGYVLAPGCPPECHPAGKPYEWEVGLPAEGSHAV